MNTPKHTPSASQEKSANPLWGGRFQGNSAPLLQQINASIDVDNRLFEEDIDGSQAHAAMLADAGIISRADAAAIQAGLETVRGELQRSELPFRVELEDIHMHIETRLKELIGDAGGRLHTGRSRNDQVVTDFRLWLRRALDGLDGDIRGLALALMGQAKRHSATILPGFTHLQPAQPVTFGHHLLAYENMLRRDRGRFRDCRERLNESPLGAAALAGTTYPINRQQTANALGFRAPMENSLDAVSSRDFALEFLSSAAILGIHLSRLAEELVLWTSPAFGFVKLSDAYTTGSSIMPNKKNPDAAELVRGKAASLLAAFQHLGGILKSLPLAYAKDLQDDKAIVFSAVDTVSLLLRAMTGMITDMTAQPEAMRRACAAGFLLATDLADWCVQELKLPFREAHHIAAKAVAICEARGSVDLDTLTESELKSLHPLLDTRVLPLLTLEQAVHRRISYGGTAPSQVMAALERAETFWQEAV
jgi:argininosuccinate lyase